MFGWTGAQLCWRDFCSHGLRTEAGVETAMRIDERIAVLEKTVADLIRTNSDVKSAFDGLTDIVTTIRLQTLAAETMLTVLAEQVPLERLLQSIAAARSSFEILSRSGRAVDETTRLKAEEYFSTLADEIEKSVRR